MSLEELNVQNKAQRECIRPRVECMHALSLVWSGEHILCGLGSLLCVHVISLKSGVENRC